MENNNLTLDAVKRAVYSWSIRFRETVYDNQQLAFLSDEYHEDLLDIGVTAKQFAEASKIARRRCKFFPKMADIVEAVDEYRANPKTKSNNIKISDTSTEHDLTPEEIETNKKRLSIMGRVVAGSLTPEEGEKLQVELNNNVEFSRRLKVVGK